MDGQKDKVLPYSLPSVWPGADPGVKAYFISRRCHYYLRSPSQPKNVIVLWPVPSFIPSHGLTRTAYLYNGCLAWYNLLITSWAHLSVKSQFPKVRQTKYTAADSCDGEICVLNQLLSWSNTHLSNSKQWFNIHILLGDRHKVWTTCPRLLRSCSRWESNPCPNARKSNALPLSHCSTWTDRPDRKSYKQS